MALVSCALPAGPGELTCRIRDRRVVEASGLAASRRHPGVFWTHNDSGGEPRLFAIDRSGRVIAEVVVEGARNRDWEDIAVDDEGRLWVGDVGNNSDARRDLAVYGIPEPARLAPHLSVRPEITLRIRYPDQWEFPPRGRDFDAEAIFSLHGHLYLLTKERFRMTRYRVPTSGGSEEIPLVWIDAVYLGDTSTEIGKGVTACDVSPDGRGLAVLTYGEVLFFDLPPPPRRPAERPGGEDPAEPPPDGPGRGARVVGRGRVHRQRGRPRLLGILFAAGLFAAWAVPADLATDGEFHRTALGFHVADRAMQGNRGHGGWEPWWLLFYPAVILLSLFPWSPWIHRAWAQWRRLADRRDRVFLGFWVLGGLLAFTLSIGKMPHYVFPIYPGLTILLGGAFSRCVAERRSLLAGREGLLILAFLSLGFAAIAATILFWLLRLELGALIPAALPSLSLLAGGLAVLWLLRARPRPVLQGIFVLAGIGGSTLLVILLVLPAMEPHRLVSRVGAALVTEVPPSTSLGQFGYRPQGLFFYLQRDGSGGLGLEEARTIRKLDDTDDERELENLLKWLSSDSAHAVVIGEKQRKYLDKRVGLDHLPGRIVWCVRGLNLAKGRWETISIHFSR